MRLKIDVTNLVHEQIRNVGKYQDLMNTIDIFNHLKENLQRSTEMPYFE
ncbi:hypothetical protein ABID42_001965 [Arcicella rosea]